MVTVDDHMCSMGWDMMEMGMKWDLMMGMKIHVHSVCTILHMHKVRGWTCWYNGRHTSSVFYSSITKCKLIRVLLERGWSQYCI